MLSVQPSCTQLLVNWFSEWKWAVSCFGCITSTFTYITHLHKHINSIKLTGKGKWQLKITWFRKNTAMCEYISRRVMKVSITIVMVLPAAEKNDSKSSEWNSAVTPSALKQEAMCGFLDRKERCCTGSYKQVANCRITENIILVQNKAYRSTTGGWVSQSRQKVQHEFSESNKWLRQDLRWHWAETILINENQKQ